MGVSVASAKQTGSRDVPEALVSYIGSLGISGRRQSILQGTCLCHSHDITQTGLLGLA